MSILKYYISTEYPVELSNELKDHVSIYSKRKSNNKLIILKELDYININIRNLLKNNFVYEVEFEKTNTYLQEKVIELINKIIKCNIFNGFNAIEIYCNEDNDLEKVNLKLPVALMNGVLIYDIKEVDENIFFEKNTLITIGQFKLENINTLLVNEKNIKILAMKKVQNYFILDILSEVRFIYNNQDEIEEIGISLYIENINVNDLNLELYSSHNIFILENNDLEDRKNAFDSMIYLKYKEENLINDNMKNICITRLIYLLEENLDKVDSLKIEFEIDGAMKVFEM